MFVGSYSPEFYQPISAFCCQAVHKMSEHCPFPSELSKDRRCYSSASTKDHRPVLANRGPARFHLKLACNRVSGGPERLHAVRVHEEIGENICLLSKSRKNIVSKMRGLVRNCIGGLATARLRIK